MKELKLERFSTEIRSFLTSDFLAVDGLADVCRGEGGCAGVRVEVLGLTVQVEPAVPGTQRVH